MRNVRKKTQKIRAIREIRLIRDSYRGGGENVWRRSNTCLNFDPDHRNRILKILSSWPYEIRNVREKSPSTKTKKARTVSQPPGLYYFQMVS
jgi:hypothetical protein